MNSLIQLGDDDDDDVRLTSHMKSGVCARLGSRVWWLRESAELRAASERVDGRTKSVIHRKGHEN